MRAGAMLLMCGALAGCGERDFDERYAEHEKNLASEAAQLEQELDRRMTEKPGLDAPSSTGAADASASPTSAETPE